MGKAITNDFSWSKSRHEKFSECLRAYYFQYYRSWGGWGFNADATAKELYLLKRLGNRYTWAGNAVHQAIRDTLMAIRMGKTVDESGIVTRLHQQMRSEFSFSKERKYVSGKGPNGFCGLVEHEYAENVTADEWKAIWKNTQEAIEFFLKSSWLSVAKSLKPQQWLEVDVMDFDKSIFYLNGVKVFAVPDFAYVQDDGTPVIVDWKTGKAREGYDDQILGYALYLENRYQLPLAKMKAALVYLNEASEKWVGIDEGALSAFREKFASSTSRMKALLADPQRNAPVDEAQFLKTENLEVCARCVFRRPCGRTSTVEAVSGA